MNRLRSSVSSEGPMSKLSGGLESAAGAATSGAESSVVAGVRDFLAPRWKDEEGEEMVDPVAGDGAAGVVWTDCVRRDLVSRLLVQELSKAAAPVACVADCRGSQLPPLSEE